MAPRGRFAALLLVLLMASMPWAPATPAALPFSETSSAIGVASTIVIGAAEGGQDDRVEVDVEEIWHSPPVPFDRSCVEAVARATEELGYSSREIVSGAGHDACYISRVAPTSMIFIPCIDGISHNEVEDAKPEWIHAGGNVLLRAMLAKAGRVE